MRTNNSPKIGFILAGGALVFGGYLLGAIGRPNEARGQIPVSGSKAVLGVSVPKDGGAAFLIATNGGLFFKRHFVNSKGDWK